MKLPAVFLALGLACAGLVLSGCATGASRTQKVTIRSLPSGAHVTVDGVPLGVTPLRVPLPRHEAHRIVLEKDGFRTGYASVVPAQAGDYGQRKLRWGLDYRFGRALELTPDDVMVYLHPQVMPAPQPENPFGEMSAKAAVIDDLLAAGQITALDRRLMIDRLVTFYSLR